MAVALWLVGAFVVLVFFGTWALQIALWLLALCLQLIRRLAIVVFGLLSMAALAVFDRRQLGRILRNQRIEAENAALLARERWN